jgi:Gene product 88
MSLRLSTDQKTANSATASGNVRIKNAFGLPSGKAFSCPGQTSICGKVCYAGRLEKAYKGFAAVMLSNWEAISVMSPREMRVALSALISEFVAECDKWNADKVFRIHHDGDFFSRDYADAWAYVVRAFPDVQFWVYTRSFTPGTNVVDLIADIPNLAVYLSVDADNSRFASAILDEYSSVRIATLAQTMADAALMIQDIREDTRPGAKCPENIKRIPLITSEGGACFSCKICVHGKADVRFAIGKV